MRVELHILQSFAPSNLNRDDTGAPKDATFGGFRRARISSQSLKRAMRAHFEATSAFDPGRQAVRTKRIVGVISDLLTLRHGMQTEQAQALTTAALGAAGFAVVDGDEGQPPKTQYLMFLPRRTAEQLAALVAAHEEELGKAVDAGPKAKNTAKKNAKKDAKQVVSNKLASEIESVLLSANDCPEIALFGRMLADSPESNVDAACQVAHALGTNRLAPEFDFYTAVDDLKPDDTSGADMMGTVQFNASCFYRYAQVDLDQLLGNLAVAEGDEAGVLRSTLAAWVRAAVEAIPTGKQNTMAAHNPPGFVMAVVSSRAPMSLANAFLAPARAEGDADLMAASVKKLTGHLDSMLAMYGTEGIRRVLWMAADEVPADCRGSLEGKSALGPAVVSRVQPLAGLVGQILETVA